MQLGDSESTRRALNQPLPRPDRVKAKSIFVDRISPDAPAVKVIASHLGTGTIDRLELPHIPDNADIQVGDLLVTSGLGGRFPPGYPVAEVIDVEQDPGRAFSHVTARPRALLDRSREVLLVWPPDIRKPMPEPETSPPEETEASGS